MAEPALPLPAVLCATAGAATSLFLFNTRRGGEDFSPNALAGFAATMAGAAVPAL
eukprot:COSAG04_NODE_20037_length_402_cov_0.841584_1_plen_54_part_01